MIEGLDGCGKSTQLDILTERLAKAGITSKQVSFPDYDAPSCAPVKMYLAGEFGSKPGDVNPFAAASFYAVDRFSSYKRNWEQFYLNGGVVVCGRYVTSNAVHQASKLPDNEREKYLDWLDDFEYKKIGIPRPDLVIFLDMPNELSRSLLESRYQGDCTKKDIHEKDESYREACREAAMFAAKKWGWVTVNCAENGKVLTRQEVADAISGHVMKLMKGESLK